MRHSPARANWQRAGFGLYVHWPFCAAKCPYCDFNSHVSATIDQSAWRRAYLAELRRCAAETPERTLSTIFFGGGTPSLMDPETVAEVIDTAQSLWTTPPTAEISLEANPGSVEAERFAAYRAAGVTRLSMGVQALNDRDLLALGRLHDVADARRAFEIARQNFDRVSFDLIYARQDQSLKMWEGELSQALDMALDHLSLYQLTIEPGTAFGRRHAAGRLAGLPEEDLAADMYDLTTDLCATSGFQGYEVSNFARPGSESRHNLIYWRGGDWLGIGPGAHGRLEIGGTRWATETPLGPQEWLRAVSQCGHGEIERRALSAQETAEEYLMMSLRLSEGADLHVLKMLGYALDQEALNELLELDMVASNGDRLRATSRGRVLLNAILRRLMTG